LAKKGYNTKMLDSITWEEAPINFKGWVNQRSRWIKGHMQTYIVHLRDSGRLRNRFGVIGILGFHCFLILPIIAYFLQILVVAASFLETKDPWIMLLKDFSILNLLCWTIFAVFLGFFAVIKNKWKNVRFIYVAFYPFYYCLHFISAIIALYQLVFKTHYWEKTSHEFDDRMNKKQIN
jgi:cellulose synthase/poly-beta-1,6-N-acetylglucosamine synthase-like glycosyltransferase